MDFQTGYIVLMNILVKNSISCFCNSFRLVGSVNEHKWNYKARKSSYQFKMVLSGFSSREHSLPEHLFVRNSILVTLLKLNQRFQSQSKGFSAVSSHLSSDNAHISLSHMLDLKRLGWGGIRKKCWKNVCLCETVCR